MSLFDEISVAVGRGDLNQFKQLIETNLLTTPALLEQTFQFEGKSVTLLGYLIKLHQEERQIGAVNLMPLIQYVYDKSTDKLLGYPVHQAVSENKEQLALWFFQKLAENNAHVNALDEKRRTILSYVLETKNLILLKAFLLCNPSVHYVSHLEEDGLPTAPLQQAILLDFEDGMQLLFEKGAVDVSPWGDFRETNVLMAARLGKLNSLQTLLNVSLRTQKFCDLDATDGQPQSWNAIEHLCYKLAEGNTNHTETLKGIASLLSCGAAAPRASYLCDILTHNKETLLELIESYVKQHKELIQPFYAKCHQFDNPLHEIFYSSKSWKNSFRKLFCISNPAALKLESLAIPEEPSNASTDVNLYAEFVKRYQAKYKSEYVKNPWSDMNWNIFQGNVDWNAVNGYATVYPNSRTGKIVAEMRLQYPAEVINKPTTVHSTVQTI